jgi:PAS domain S-box-containing protein
LTLSGFLPILTYIEGKNIDNTTKILVTDDDSELLNLTTTVLRRAGYEVLEASTGQEGLMAARTHRPDLVLMDVVLPDISGIEACRQMKEDEDLKDIFVILTSGVRTSSDHQANGLNMGADGFIVKPVSNKELLARIQSMVRIKRAEEALQTSETRYRRLFETAQDGILILNAETGQIDDVNPFLVDMLGYTYEEFVGKKLWEIGAFKNTEKSKAALTELQHKGYVRYEDLPLATKDGREIDVEFVSNTYPVNHHKVIQCNVRDITDRIRAEKELQKAHDELEKRVVERTTQLVEANKSLKGEIAKRTIVGDELKESRERLRNLTKHLQKIREEERASLSRELHDELGQVLTGMKMDIRWIERQLPEKSTSIFERLHSTIILIDEAIRSVQRISMALRPPALDDFGLSEAIKLVLTNFEKKANFTCTFISTPQKIVLNREISTEVFRICQEALTNIARHADAKHVTVLLQNTGDKLTMEVRDDGRGITKKEMVDHTSLGLTGMRERAYSVEGNLTIMGMKGKGTIVTLTVPLNEKNEKNTREMKRGLKKPPKEA